MLPAGGAPDTDLSAASKIAGHDLPEDAPVNVRLIAQQRLHTHLLEIGLTDAGFAENAAVLGWRLNRSDHCLLWVKSGHKIIC